MVATVIAIILFILTEDMSLPMIFIDKWTLWHIVITVASIILAIFSRKKYEDEEEDEQDALGTV